MNGAVSVPSWHRSNARTFRCGPGDAAHGGWDVAHTADSSSRRSFKRYGAVRVPYRLQPLAVILTVTWLVLLALPAGAAQWPWSRPTEPPQQPHPAVVRVSVEETDGMSHGSGTLVDIRSQFALVVTNWHVVRDASGAIRVTFPDGFRSAARVLRVDRDWDLAALLIWRPQVAPVPIAGRAAAR